MTADASQRVPLLHVSDADADVPSRRGILSAPTRSHLGEQLRAYYGALLTDDPPDRLVDLIARLEITLTARSAAEALAFRRDLTGAIQGLRAFAISLATNSALADDLVQETVLRAWANQHRFIPGSNLSAWLCTILRNQFYSEMRKRKREIEDADGVEASRLTVLPMQEHNADLRVVWGRIATLPVLQREALLLVGAQGLTYEAAAEVMGCQTGTVKSRVSRARASLAEALA